MSRSEEHFQVFWHCLSGKSRLESQAFTQDMLDQKSESVIFNAGPDLHVFYLQLKVCRVHFVNVVDISWHRGSKRVEKNIYFKKTTLRDLFYLLKFDDFYKQLIDNGIFEIKPFFI